MTDVFTRRCTALAGLSLLAMAIPVAAAPSWLQQLRALFGYSPLLAPGGSRGSGSGPAAGDAICLISPRLQEGLTPPTAIVHLPSPTLLAVQPLAEWRLEDSDGTRLAGALARSDRPITGPIPWPLAPLQPDQRVTLRLRTMQASGSDFGVVQLQAATAAEQNLALQHLADPRDRSTVVRELASGGQRALALELLFAPSPTPSPALTALREAINRAGACAADRQHP